MARPRTALPAPRFMQTDAAEEVIRRLHGERTSCAIVQLVAPGAGEGTTSITWDLALAAAGHVGLRVLLVAVEPDHAWADQLAGALQSGAEPDRPRRVGDTSLHLAQITTQQLTADGLAVLGLWRAGFDLVLLDTQSIERSGACLALAPVVDTSLLVIAAERTDMDKARRLRDRIWAAGGTTAGVIMNRRRHRLPGFVRRRT